MRLRVQKLAQSGLWAVYDLNGVCVFADRSRRLAEYVAQAAPVLLPDFTNCSPDNRAWAIHQAVTLAAVTLDHAA